MAITFPDSESFRRQLDERRRRWSEEDARDKISNRVTMRLAEFYRQADPPTQRMFDGVLADWVRSLEPGVWFDGAALIGEFQVCSALPAVREAAEYWRNRLTKYNDFSRGGEYGLQRSYALSGVDILGALVRKLEARCAEGRQVRPVTPAARRLTGVCSRRRVRS